MSHDDEDQQQQHAEEQEMEAEALTAIFDTHFHATNQYPHTIWTIELYPHVGDDEPNHVACRLIVNVPHDYPTALPSLQVELIQGLADDEHLPLLQTLANDEAQSNEGTPCVFAVCERLREWLVDNNVKGLDDQSMHAQMLRKQQQQQQQQAKQQGEVRSEAGISVFRVLRTSFVRCVCVCVCVCVPAGGRQGSVSHTIDDRATTYHINFVVLVHLNVCQIEPDDSNKIRSIFLPTRTNGISRRQGGFRSFLCVLMNRVPDNACRTTIGPAALHLSYTLSHSFACLLVWLLWFGCFLLQRSGRAFESQTVHEEFTEAELEELSVRKKREEGTPCNKENFEKWKVQFEAEMALAREALEQEAMDDFKKAKKIKEEKSTRQTGYQLFAANMNLEALEAAAEHAEADEAEENLDEGVDEDLFQDDVDLEDLDFESDDDEEDDDEDDIDI